MLLFQPSIFIVGENNGNGLNALVTKAVTLINAFDFEIYNFNSNDLISNGRAT